MSVSLQKSHPIQGLVGLKPNGQVVDIYNIYCIRKNATGIRYQPNYNLLPRTRRQPIKYFTMYSTPKMYKCDFAKQNSDFWCHPFRSDVKSKYLPKKMRQFLMSESDFIDETIIPVNKRNIKRPKKYDFFYMTLNNKKGFTYKGLNEFVDAVKVLCLEQGLRGQVLPYFPNKIEHWQVDFTQEQRQILKEADPFLKYHWGWKTSAFLNRMMSGCHFGFFPNVMDCSPRIITECLSRDVPILVNKNIWGGWKYVEETTGREFDPQDPQTLREASDFIVNNQQTFSPKATYMSRYGFEKSSRRLAKYINRDIKNTGCTHIYFSGYRVILERLHQSILRGEHL